MLKKKLRFLGRIGTEASVVHSPIFTLRIAKNNLAYNRYRFVVTKKIDKRAIVRNRIKRRMSSCIEQIIEKSKKGYDFLFYAKKDIITKKQEEICLTVQEIYTKEGVLT